MSIDPHTVATIPAITHVHSPLAGTLLAWEVGNGQLVRSGQVVALIEAMKMVHELRAPRAGQALDQLVEAGAQVTEGELLLKIEHINVVDNGQKPDLSTHPTPATAHDPAMPEALAQLLARTAQTLDAARPEAMLKRHASLGGSRSARENVADLCEAGSFIEYGALAVAAQATRRSAEDLVANTPADGMVTGIGRVHGRSVVVLAYDATVLAGTQGMRNHQKTDRMLGLALKNRLPVVLFAEGGGGRPGDVDMPIVAGLHVPTFASFARLSGQVPLVAVVHGRCFAGNAVLAACADVLIATHRSNIGLGGPAMVEGGGLGVFAPEAIGPAPVQHASGVIDILVETEAQGVARAKQFLAWAQPHNTAPATSWQEPAESDATAHALRHLVPVLRNRAYDSQVAILALCDAGSVCFLRDGFAPALHTAIAQLGGQPVGIMANNPSHLGGALDAAACAKATRFVNLCNSHRVPLISLVDCPGFMVGPGEEARAQVRAAGDLLVAAAKLTVPVLTVVMRKGYGLGAMAMAFGSFHTPLFNVAWPSAEFGAMGLEGAVKLGFKRELAATANPAAHDALYAQLLAKQFDAGSAINMAQTLEIDAVIDPADTRSWLLHGLAAARSLDR